ncbi:hypothetical protein BDP27DRAFT_1316321 [Rhodocollybia butyracea]|uniref:Uncharacterized protein n=1 Tax=Rhodocollybia butyracea TaxID=206335 RepID=A0A9P5UCC2_9AGAR|nr:hypothetical protein BDP27DRAFT_1316321 [Rhodocollybia butyracea]
MSSTNDTSTSSDTTMTSATTASLSPTWGPPKAPLAPHRLAKLANALGVPTPVPVHHRIDRMSSPYLISSFSTSSLTTPDAYASIRETYASLRRSPTPSSSGSVANYGTSYTYTSKFLLHVVPPISLPHESQLRDNVISGSGYHSHFRRGILVPLHPTFQAQLWAIAREYSLPSTSGIVLYIVNSDQNTPTGDVGHDEPGPRLSEEIWKHLWTRVWKAEREEMPPAIVPLGLPGPVSPSEFPSPMSTPFLSNEPGIPLSPLKPFITSPVNSASDSALTSYPSPSTPSTSSISTLAFTRSRSPISERGDIETPLTSHSNSFDSSDDPNLIRANSLPLPGLNSPSLMPILAKVEFEIDRRKASWYEPWVKRRRAKKAKAGQSDTIVSDPLKRLKLQGRAQAGSQVSLFPVNGKAEHEQFSDDDESEEDVEDEDIGDENETARVLSTSGTGMVPSPPTFATNDDIWENTEGSLRNHLVITDEQRDDDDNESDGFEQGELTKGAAEISEIMAQMGNNPEIETLPGHLNSPPRKHVPPPLVLHPVGDAASKELRISSPLNSANLLNEPSSSSSSEGTHLPYLKSASTVVSYEEEVTEFSEVDSEFGEGYPKLKSPQESEKRIGGVYDDLDLDLGDTDDPHDRRRSQIILKAKLDEIERNLAQLSPRALKIDLEDVQQPPGSPFLGVPSSSPPVLMNSDVLPPTPNQAGFQNTNTSSTSPLRAQWPAVPFEEIKDTTQLSRGSRTESSNTSPPSPPRLAINGVSNFSPSAFKRRDSHKGSSDSTVSDETMRRRREAQEEEQLNFYPALNNRTGTRPSYSPVIPLSPDPFGRFSSTPETGTSRPSIRVWDHVPVGGSGDHLTQNSKQRQSTGLSNSTIREAPPRTSDASSRFSTDSTKDNIEVPAPTSLSIVTADGIKDKRTTVISMKGIKKLWRKSNKNSVSSNGPPTPVLESPLPPPRPSYDDSRSLHTPPTPSLPTGRAPSPQNPPQSSSAPARPTRPSQELYIPDIPEQLAIPLHPTNGRPAPMPIIAAQMHAGLHRSQSGDRMHFDQESPYPMPVPRNSQRKLSVSTINVQPTSRTPSPANSGGTTSSTNANVRKSILKWKAAAAAQQDGELADVSSTSRPSSNSTVHPRSSSLSGNGSHRSSVISDIPPSPKVPEHFLSSRTPPEHLRTRSHLTTSSTDSRSTNATDASSFQSQNSPPSSQTSHNSPPALKSKIDLTRGSSLDSGARSISDGDSDARPSIDSSQFEMVSPKMQVQTLSYPYTTVSSQ